MKNPSLFFLAFAPILFAQNPPSLSNAQLQTRAFSGALSDQLRSASPSWFGYQIKTVRHNENCCWSDANHGCWLEGNSARVMQGVRSNNNPIPLEGSASAAVLFRVAGNHIEKVQVFSMSCPLDAGGLPFVWLTGVSAHASLAELRQLALSSSESRLTEGVLTAIAQHEDAEADTILAALSTPDHPDKMREKVAFWLGASRGATGVTRLQQMIHDDPSEHVRDKVVFALSISKQPAALNTLIQTANGDPSAHVRSQAIFWLAQKAGKQAETTIVNAIRNDPDTEVKKKAVFALSQLPKDDGVPKLIEVARTQKNGEVRKQAFFWLGQSGDPRALAFLQQILQTPGQ